MLDSGLKKQAAHPTNLPVGTAPKSAAPPAAAPAAPLPAAPLPAAPGSAPDAKSDAKHEAQKGQALSSLFSFLSDAGGAKTAPGAPAKSGLPVAAQPGVAAHVGPGAQPVSDSQKAAQAVLASKMAAKAVAQVGPAEQKVALAAKMAAKATGPSAPPEQKAEMAEKLAAAAQSAPDSKKAALSQKLAAATSEKAAPAAQKVGDLAPGLKDGGAQPGQAPRSRPGDAGPGDAQDDRKILDVDFQEQEYGNWCGPAATRIALSARMDNPPTQRELAEQLGTNGTVGTAHIGLVTAALNDRLGTGYYENKLMPNDPPTPEQRELLWKDIVMDIDNNYPIVANIVAPPSNHPPGYPDNETIYHYVSIIGYDKSDQAALIADPARFHNNPEFQSQYWLSLDQLSTLIPPKGYAA